MPTAPVSNTTIIFDIDHSRRRLTYYTELKARSGFEKSKAITKWIDIYAERVQKLERQASRIGLKTQLKMSDKPSAAATA